MKKQAALVTVVVFVAGVLVQLSGPVPNRSRVSAAASRGSGIDGSLGRGSAEAAPVVSKQRIAASYGKLPLTFAANQGQTDARVKFISRGPGYSLFLTGTEAVLALKRGKGSEQAEHSELTRKTRAAAVEGESRAASAVLRMNLAGANSAARVEGIDELPGRSNYFIGNDPAKWRIDVPHYAEVRYRDVYPGVDLVYYGNQQRIEHDFILAPGADPKQIRFAVNGAQKMELSASGDLVLRTSDGEVRLQKPTIYQQEGTVRKEVAGGYTVMADNRVGFQLAAYDATQPLVIDPVLEYATYVGGSDFDTALGIAVDAAGSAYITGWTSSLDFPTQDPLQSEKAGPPSQPAPPEGRNPWDDIYVTKLTPDGSGLVYSTYLGGGEQDRAYGIAVDGAGNAYVAGRTWSTDFPVQNALQPTKAAGLFANAVVVKLNAQGNALIYSTYLGGSGADWAYSIATDVDGNAYLAGVTNSPDFPQNGLQHFLGGVCDLPAFMLAGPRGPCVDVFVAKVSHDGSRLVYSARLGGNKNELFPNIAVDAVGNAYVAGQTQSEDFPTTDQAFQSRYGGGSWDAFVSKLDARGNTLVYSTYLGGTGDDEAFGIALTPGCGSRRHEKETNSQDEADDGQAAGLGPGRRHSLSTPCFAYVTGDTNSTNFPTTPGAFQTDLTPGTCGNPPVTSRCFDEFVVKLDAVGSELLYSTYLGGSGDDSGDGIAVDAAGNAYVAGETRSISDFPTTDDALQRKLGGGTWVNCPPASRNPCPDGTVSILTAHGSALAYSTYLGGTDLDRSSGIAVHPAGCGGPTPSPSCSIYVAGPTRSTNFPRTENAFQTEWGGGTCGPLNRRFPCHDTYVVKFAPKRAEL